MARLETSPARVEVPNFVCSYPESGEIALKRTWAIRHDGYLFGSGYYEPASEDASMMQKILRHRRSI